MRNRSHNWKLIALCLNLCLFGATASGAAGITNGSFETGPILGPGENIKTLWNGSTELPGWTIIGASIDFIGPNHWPASDGNNSLDMNGLNAGGIQQMLTTNPGQTYDIGFDLSGNPGQQKEVLRILEVSAAGSSQQYSFDASTKSFQDMGWVARSFSFTATGTQTLLTFATFSPVSEGSHWGPALDNVHITPEPSTALMLGLGMVSLASRRRRS